MIGSLEDALAKRPTTDLTVDGRCSSCGQCCNRFLMVTNAEVKRLRRYVTVHKIAPADHLPAVATKPMFDLTCPFRDNDARRCTVYPVRPAVCRRYTCSARLTDAQRAHRLRELGQRGRYRDVDIMTAVFGPSDDRRKE